MIKENTKENFKKYFSEFALIFISVILAFALTEWSSNQGKKISEEKIFLEILNGLKKDSLDLIGNIEAHKNGVTACNYWRRVITEGKANKDSLILNYFLLTRNVICVQNISGYETLKSKGLETIENDTLRSKIINLYEFNYQIMKKFEEDYKENQFFANYFFRINDKIAPNLIFDSTGNIVDIALPLKLTSAEKNILLSYLWKIQMSRSEREYSGKSLKKKINSLHQEIVDQMTRTK
jgi:hypothetical protein